MSDSSDQPAPAPAQPSKPAKGGAQSAGSKSTGGQPDDDPNAPEAKKIIRNHAIASVASGLLLGSPILSLGLFVGAQVRMIRKLARLYEVEFSEQRAKSIIGSLVGVGTAGSVMNLFRLLPGVGALATLATPVASTYALGKVFTEHFSSGGTFLTFDPERGKERYEEALEEKKKDEESYVGIKP